MAEPMVELFVSEARQFLEQLEQISLDSEKKGSFSIDDVNEIFRAMHTIKASAAMMMFDEISTLAHSAEDIFYYIREFQPQEMDTTAVTDLVLNVVDFIRTETDKLDSGAGTDMSSQEMREYTKDFLRELMTANGDDPDVDLRKVKNTGSGSREKPKHYYIGAAKTPKSAARARGERPAGGVHVFAATLFFQADCGLEEIRAFGVLNNLKDKVIEMHSLPERILEDDTAADTIKSQGFRIFLTTKMSRGEVQGELDQTINLEHLELEELGSTAECAYWPTPEAVALSAMERMEPVVPVLPLQPDKQDLMETMPASESQHGEAGWMISVQTDKLDKLMDLVEELPAAEAMVTQNPDLAGLELNSFQKAASRLHKINGELQESVMALCMVPLEGTFRKMNRIVRDMTKKLGKKARLVMTGGETEVDRGIDERLSAPLMHIVRNSIDHGIELPEVRTGAGKKETGTVVLSAKRADGELVITIEDDGAGLNREKILARARENGILEKSEEDYTDGEVYSFIFAPGFSTKDEVTEFSGRGVGMDAVLSGIRELGGSVAVDSEPGLGSTTIIRIPLAVRIRKVSQELQPESSA